jgi:hypothetical protein
LQDKARRPAVNLDLSTITRSASSSQLVSPARKKSRLSLSIDAILNNSGASDPTASQRREPSPPSPRVAGSTASKDTMSSTTTYLGRNGLASEKDQLIRSMKRQSLEDTSKDSSADENRSKNEDIFLNIAKSSVSRRDSGGRRVSPISSNIDLPRGFPRRSGVIWDRS